jgi:hypothetical protein
MQPLSEGDKIAHSSRLCRFTIQQYGDMRTMSLGVPGVSGKRVVLRTGLNIVPELQVTVYHLTVLPNDVQPLTSLYCDENHEVKTASQWCLKRGITFSKSHSATHAPMITAQSVRYPVYLLICANARITLSGLQCPMLLGDGMHHHLYSIYRD